MRKLIFLDIDGVIANSETVDGKTGLWKLNKRCQENLGIILKKTDAEIILSSSWRKHTVEDTIDYMQKKGFFFFDEITGVTIRAYHYVDSTAKIHLSIPRGVEIKQWIDSHIHSDNGKNWQKKQLGKDYTYVIIDDESDMLLEHRNNFIQTSSRIGLTEKDAVKAIEILNQTKIC